MYSKMEYTDILTNLFLQKKKKTCIAQHYELYNHSQNYRDQPLSPRLPSVSVVIVNLYLQR